MLWLHLLFCEYSVRHTWEAKNASEIFNDMDMETNMNTDWVWDNTGTDMAQYVVYIVV